MCLFITKNQLKQLKKKCHYRLIHFYLYFIFHFSFFFLIFRRKSHRKWKVCIFWNQSFLVHQKSSSWNLNPLKATKLNFTYFSSHWVSHLVLLEIILYFAIWCNFWKKIGNKKNFYIPKKCRKTNDIFFRRLSHESRCKIYRRNLSSSSINSFHI